MVTNFESHKYVNFVQSTKIGTHKNKAIHSISPAGNRNNLDELFKFWRKHEIWYTGSFDQYKEI